MNDGRLTGLGPGDPGFVTAGRGGGLRTSDVAPVPVLDAGERGRVRDERSDRRRRETARGAAAWGSASTLPGQSVGGRGGKP